MAAGKNKDRTGNLPRSKEGGSTERTDKSPADRPRPPEPFEECGPSGGYGGAGTEEEGEEGKEKD